jgi:plexin A
LLLQDSPSSKLLYAKDIPRYRQMVMQLYHDIQEMPPVSDAQMADHLSQHSEVGATPSARFYAFANAGL